MKSQVFIAVLITIIGGVLLVGASGSERPELGSTFPISLFQAAAEGDFERTLNVGGGVVDLQVATGSGDVTVRRGGSGSVRITGRISVGRRDSNPESTLQMIQNDPPIEQNGNRIRIGRNTDDDDDLMQYVSIDYEIVVPEGTSLDVNTGSGDLEIRGLGARVEVTTGSGDIELADIGGEVEARTGSGDIEAENIAGSFEANSGSGSVELSQTAEGDVSVATGSGDIELTGIRGGLRVATGSGDIEVDGEPLDEWSLASSSGEISIRLPSGFAFDLDVETSSGDIDIDYPITTEGPIRRNRLQGQVNGGGVEIQLRTSSGSITIE